jgi:hypothetical protein
LLSKGDKMAFEKYVLPNEDVYGEYPKLNIHMFRAILQEYLDGEQTGTACRTALESQLGVTLSTDEVTDITNILSYITGGSDLANKMNRMDEVYRVFVLAEAQVSWYDTRAEIRTRLSLVDDT